VKLYALTLSPFAMRARMALQFKGQAYDMDPPPGGSTRSEAYLAINPIGKLPVLVTAEGLAIAESETIIDYLDDTFPEPPLMPADAGGRAQARNAVRCLELYVTPAMSRLFRQMDPATRDAAIVDAELEQVRSGFALVEHFVDDATFAVGQAPSKADCMLLPSLLLADTLAEIFQQGNLLAHCPHLSGYRSKARLHHGMGALWTETAEAMARYRASA